MTMDLEAPPPAWSPPGEEEIARASEQLSLGMDTEAIARSARMALGMEDSHRRAARFWAASRTDRRRVEYAAGDDPWNAAAYTFHVPGTPTGLLKDMRVAVKENVMVEGVPCEHGTGLARGHLADADATVVQRALHAGASITATGRMGPWGLTITGETQHGPVLTPGAPGHMTWGSSSGCAALVAADLADAALCVDQAGSGRAPAAGCGLLALLPTRGMIPMTGVGGFLPMLDRIAVVGRGVQAVAPLASVLTGHDGLDLLTGPTVRPQNWVRGLVPDITGLRIGLVTEALDPDMCVPAVAERVRGQATLLSLLGAEVTEVSIPTYRLARDVLMLLTLHSGVPAMLHHHGGHSPTTATGDPDLAARIAQRLRTHPQDLPDAVKLCAALAAADNGQPSGYGATLGHALLPTIIQSWTAPMTGSDAVDLILTPTVPTTPPPVPGPDTTQDERLAQSIGWGTTHTCPANLTGQPAIQIPAGNIDGLHVGIQLIAPALQEHTLLTVAIQLETAQGGHVPLISSTPPPHRTR